MNAKHEMDHNITGNSMIDVIDKPLSQSVTKNLKNKILTFFGKDDFSFYTGEKHKIWTGQCRQTSTNPSFIICVHKEEDDLYVSKSILHGSPTIIDVVNTTVDCGGIVKSGVILC